MFGMFLVCYLASNCFSSNERAAGRSRLNEEENDFRDTADAAAN